MPIPSRTSVCDFCSLSFINKAPSFDFVVSPSVQHTEVCNSHGTEEIDWAAFNVRFRVLFILIITRLRLLVQGFFLL